MNVILLLLDSLNKRYLSCYGNKEVKTPNIDRLVSKSVVFENHFTNSLPCVPARRDLLTGRIEFMFKGWGQTEPFDRLLANEINKTGMETAIITDHYHYWNGTEGYGYTQDYRYMDYIRGAENDNHGFPFTPNIFTESIDRYRFPFESKLFGRNHFRQESECDYTTPKIFDSVEEYFEKTNIDKGFFLHIECFDPHEPFDYPEPYRSMYGAYDEGYTVWPPYQNEERAINFRDNYKEGEVEFIKAQYKAGITFVDKYIGKLLDIFDKKGLWENTALILTTDHGHEMFEKGKFGKSYPYYLTVSNIPLIIYHPNYKPCRIESLTQTSDLYATILDMVGKKDYKSVNGKSILNILERKEENHEGVVFGWFGRGVGYADKDYVYISGCNQNMPLHWYSTKPKIAKVGVEVDKIRFEDAVSGKFIDGVNYPVWKIPCDGLKDIKEVEHLYKRTDDEQLNDLAKKEPEIIKEYRAKLLKILREMKSPEENVARLMLE